ncbi:hypothetical protein NPIL_233351, partial [Nephila pilipes]
DKINEWINSDDKIHVNNPTGPELQPSRNVILVVNKTRHNVPGTGNVEVTHETVQTRNNFHLINKPDEGTLHGIIERVSGMIGTMPQAVPKGQDISITIGHGKRDGTGSVVNTSPDIHDTVETERDFERSRGSILITIIRGKSPEVIDDYKTVPNIKQNSGSIESFEYGHKTEIGNKHGSHLIIDGKHPTRDANLKFENRGQGSDSLKIVSSEITRIHHPK